MKDIVERILNYTSKTVDFNERIDLLVCDFSWKAFVQYLHERVFDAQQIQDRSSPVFSQVKLEKVVLYHPKRLLIIKYTRTRNQWLDDLHREFNERDRIKIIDRFMANIANNDRVRLVN